MSRPIRCMRGFTAVESLAVAAAVSVLVSVLLPALQNARSSSRDVDCRNRLKQLGLAHHNYNDTYKSFPPGWVTRRPDGKGHPSTGWHTSILPYINHARLFNQLELTDTVYDTKELALLKTVIADYRCPFDSIGDTNPLRGGWGTSNFAGNFGDIPIPRWSSSGFWPGHASTPRMPDRNGAQRIPTGVLFANSSIRFRDILDGTSNTFLAGEKCVIGRSAIWPGPRSNFHESDVVVDGSNASALNRSETGYSSRHPNGIIHFLMCDGAVHPIQETLDSQPKHGMLQKLSNRYDGLTLGEF